MSWDDAGFVVASRNRRSVLLKLEVPRTPTVIAKSLNLNIANVSRTLSELEEKGLAKCLNPEKKVGRIYSLTSKGKKVAEKIRSME
jgi:DNA-binding MarR family transcriptional regulator